jgi:hypothetical protein
MKIKTILLTTIISSSLLSKAQNWGDVLNTAKDAVITNSTTIIDAAKTNSAVVIDKATSIVTGYFKSTSINK